jgi:membrane associated rhomboid family serine protease
VLPFPIGDENPTRRRPVVNLSLIGVNAAFFLYFNVLRGEGLFGLASEDARAWGLLVERPTVATLLTSMFLHAGPLHLLGNMWFLHLFGDNVEDKLGRVPYLLLYLGWGCAATAAFLLTANASLPLVGASGAISGVMGAYVVFFPRARIRMIWWMLVFIMPFALPALVVVGMYFLQDLFLGLLVGTRLEGGTAYAAHTGGMIAGVVAGLLLKPFLRRRGGDTAWDRDTGFAPGGRGAAAPAGLGDPEPYEPPRTFPLPGLRDQLIGAVLDGRMDLALDLHGRWRESPGRVSLPPGVSMEIAHEVLRRGRVDEAEGMYRAFLEEHPRGGGAAEARFRLGLICARARGDRREAREFLRRAAAEHPDPETAAFARRELDRL